MVFNLITIAFMRKYADTISEFIEHINEVGVNLSVNDKQIIKGRYTPQIRAWIDEHTDRFIPAVFWAQMIVGITLGYLLVTETTSTLMNNIAAVTQATVIVVAVIVFRRVVMTGKMIEHINNMMAQAVNTLSEKETEENSTKSGD